MQDPEKLKQNIEQERVNAYLEKKYQDKQRQYLELSQKSYIIQNQKKTMEQNPQEQSELHSLMAKIKRAQQDKKKIDQSNIWDKEYIKYLIRNNSEIFTLLLLETSGLIVTYPFNTIKTRIQSRHPLEDICFFQKNNVQKQPLYRGIAQAMISTTIATSLNSLTSRLANLELSQNDYTRGLNPYQRNTIAYCIADVVSAPFRLPFEIKKQFIQMNIVKFELKQYNQAMFRSFFPFVLRDISFRFTFNILYQGMLFWKQYYTLLTTNDPYLAKMAKLSLNRKNPDATYEQKVTAMVTSTMVALILSNPFDMVATRLTVQGYNKYSGFFNCLKTIVREEKISKLFLSGYWTRSIFYLLNGSIIMNFYDKLLFMVDDAYGPE